MAGKTWCRIIVMIATSVWITACGNSATTVPTATALPTATTAPTVVLTPSAIPTLIPTLTAGEMFREMSAGWRVAYLDQATGQRCVTSGDGSNTLCLDGGYNDVFYAWSPDGSRVAVLVGKWTSEGNVLMQSAVSIYIWELGKGFIAFHEPDDRQYFQQPAWSPDGKSLAYRNGTQIFVERLDGTLLIDVTRFLDAEANMYPHWSPDGRKILFSSAARVPAPPGSNMAYDVEHAEVMVVSPDGSDPINLSQHPASDIMPRWSPDGNWIAFFSDRDGSYDLYMMRSDGSGTRKVAPIDLARDDPFYWMTYGWDAHGVNYTWLPGGKHILFEDQLIDIETGEVIRIPIPADWGFASWFAPRQDESLLPIPTPHCAAAWSQLYEGIHAVVSGGADDQPNRVRKSPSMDAEVVSQIYPGTIVKVTGGPVCADGLVFWQVEHESIPGGAGWTAEGETKGESFFLEPYKP